MKFLWTINWTSINEHELNWFNYCSISNFSWSLRLFRVNVWNLLRICGSFQFNQKVQAKFLIISNWLYKFQVDIIVDSKLIINSDDHSLNKFVYKILYNKIYIFFQMQGFQILVIKEISIIHKEFIKLKYIYKRKTMRNDLDIHTIFSLLVIGYSRLQSNLYEELSR